MDALPGPKTNTKTVFEWFFAEYGHRLSQSTVFESLNKTLAKLDKATSTTALRQRAGNWPDLESTRAIKDSNWECK